jgi:general secretion pathway protein B
MSFILDALRKSEHDRQREKGPGLAEVAVATPKPRKNVWASVVVGLLVVNLLAVGVLLLRRAGKSSSEAATASVAAPNAAANSRPTTPPMSGPTGYPGQGSATSPASNPSSGANTGVPATPYPRVMPGTVPPVLQPALPADDGGGTHNPLADEISNSAADDDGYDPGYDSYQDGAPYPTAPPGVNAPPTKRGTVVYQTAPEAEAVTSPSLTGTRAAPSTSGARAAGSVSTLPTLDEIEGQAGLPALNVQLHVYSTKPQERFVFVNSHRYKEGDTMQEGPHVDRITPDGAELSYRGQRFVLPRQ